MSSLVFPKWLEKRWADEKAEAEYKAETERLYHKYYEDHKACPACGSTNLWTTTGPSGPTPYQRSGPDKNRAKCQCGWLGIKDDMVPVSEPKIVYNLTEVNGKTRCVCRQLYNSEEKE